MLGHVKSIRELVTISKDSIEIQGGVPLKLASATTEQTWA
jgi:hypothetical protein